MVALASGIQATGAGRWLPQEISPLITFMAGLPVLLRLGLSLSAGFVEEVFFRGFLQGRMGILASSALFVLAHLTYGQPLMLVGIALLSLVFAQLTRWRHNVLPAMAAHAVFDAVQLLFMLPTQVPQAGSPPLGIC
ncbi:MAG: CPBP family intramembrane metalloprotease [Acidobacteria bacterium]|nr:CPBP family intramembrane metalloprotease [Acidobacteriota bacterium]